MGYTIESCVEGLDDWRKYSLAFGHKQVSQFAVPGLRIEAQYLMRVAALNIAGTGPYAVLPNPVQPKKILVEPDIELSDDMRKHIEIKAGYTLKLFAQVIGRPEPKIKWTKEV